MNHFGDLTQAEYRKNHLGKPRDHSVFSKAKRTDSTNLERQLRGVPDLVDWRTEGYVTPVKNQGEHFSHATM